MNKLPRITFGFWIMKICATTLGETAGYLLSMTLHIGYAISSIILLGAFLSAFTAQLLVKKYHPLLYWLVILATSTAGTTMSDFMDRTLGLGYMKGSALLFVVLLVVLAIWRLSVGTLSVQNITTRKAELLYWVAILLSNTLGTAVGDFMADSSGLGFIGGASVVASSIGLVVLMFFTTKISHIALFWMAFILTRPLGATVGDILTKMPDKGGLGFGTIGSSLVLVCILGVMIAITTKNQNRLCQRSSSPAP